MDSKPIEQGAVPWWGARTPNLTNKFGYLIMLVWHIKTLMMKEQRPLDVGTTKKNKEVYIENARRRKREMQEYVWTEKSNPCMDCGVQYPGWVMQFDHRPEEVKSKNISVLINLGSWDKLKAEIAKCDLVCANCHIMRTAARGGWTIEIT